jgi:chromosome segregation ATPase
LQRQGELPTEDALRKAREHRDRGWKLVLADWKGPSVNEEFVPGTPLEEAFPQAIVRVDDIADRLRKQAEAVAQAEEKRFQLAECEKRARDAEKEIEKLQDAANECQESWSTEWSACGIAPRSPSEMTEWREEWREFKQRLEKLRAAEESLQAKASLIQSAKKKLAAVLGNSETKEFSVLFEAARSRVQAGETAGGRRSAITDQLGNLNRELGAFEENRAGVTAAVTAARQQWKAQCKAVGLPENTSPDAGLALLEERKQLLAKFDEWLELTGEAKSAVEAINQYTHAVAAKARTLAIEGDTTEALESALWKALTNARKAQIRHDQLTEQIGAAQGELQDVNLRAAQADQSLTQLLQLARLGAADELEPLLAHLEKRDAIQGRIQVLRETLGGLAHGQAVDDFIARVRAENADTLPERKSRAEQAKAEMKSTLGKVNQTLFELAQQRARLEKAGDAAADFRQQAEACAATLRRDAARFVRLRLAMHLLQNQIERFRKENQGPLLAKSGAVFNTITCGAFSGLGADFNAEDIPVLVGLRPDDSKVSITGMSDGSRDQLFLALRLAALEQHLDAHEPMPLILDDLLMTFDNDRARAILPQLCSLAQRTQIFLFTHHDHLVELCRQTLGDGQFQLHRLGQAA